MSCQPGPTTAWGGPPLPASGPARQEILQYPLQLIAQGADVFPLPGPAGLNLFAGPGLGVPDVALASDAGVDVLEAIGGHGPWKAPVN